VAYIFPSVAGGGGIAMLAGDGIEKLPHKNNNWDIKLNYNGKFN
jgi:hypothetical protein